MKEIKHNSDEINDISCINNPCLHFDNENQFPPSQHNSRHCHLTRQVADGTKSIVQPTRIQQGLQ
jgi:hypothetical protein